MSQGHVATSKQLLHRSEQQFMVPNHWPDGPTADSHTSIVVHAFFNRVWPAKIQLKRWASMVHIQTGKQGPGRLGCFKLEDLVQCLLSIDHKTRLQPENQGTFNRT